MDKTKFYAVNNGQCYVKAYGRKLVKKGVEIANITDCENRLIFKKVRKALTKELEKCLRIPIGAQIEFNAVMTKEGISYISDLKTREEKYE